MSASSQQATSPENIARELKQEALKLGFSFARIARYQPPAHADQLEPWLRAGKHGSMNWLARDPERRADPRLFWPEGRSLLTAGMNHFQHVPIELLQDPSRGRFAQYAWGLDYHDLLTERLRSLGETAARMTGNETAYKACVDTGALMERPIAADAGTGFIGKHTLLINRHLGSRFFLGELLLNIELPPDSSTGMTFGCGECHRCGDACPTGALDTEWSVDARLCISYLTIEHRGPIPRKLRRAIDNRVFGCDTCQDVCPYNARMLKPTEECHLQTSAPDRFAPKLLDLIMLDDEGFKARFRGTAVMRTKRKGFLRNVAVALGNWGSDEAVVPLKNVLQDPEEWIRAHAAWALGEIGTGSAKNALRKACATEKETWVREEFIAALEGNPA
ncbi:MAG: tRNA epoxyqueuosine(34) reductase QueG [bacterium]